MYQKSSKQRDSTRKFQHEKEDKLYRRKQIKKQRVTNSKIKVETVLIVKWFGVDQTTQVQIRVGNIIMGGLVGLFTGPNLNLLHHDGPKLLF